MKRPIHCARTYYRLRGKMQFYSTAISQTKTNFNIKIYLEEFVGCIWTEILAFPEEWSVINLFSRK